MRLLAGRQIQILYFDGHLQVSSRSAVRVLGGASEMVRVS